MIQSNFPCKCSHLEEDHDWFVEDQGGMMYNENTNKEEWQSFPVEIPVCTMCNNTCAFDPMTNLEYLEFQYEKSNQKS